MAGEGSMNTPLLLPQIVEHKKEASTVVRNIDLNKDCFEFGDEEEVFGHKTECMVCHVSDFVVKMEAPCACKGTIKVCVCVYFIMHHFLFVKSRKKRSDNIVND
ncbi:hypothetical protein ACOSQ3_028466 [Xanthoceras sorbifolium]